MSSRLRLFTAALGAGLLASCSSQVDSQTGPTNGVTLFDAAAEAGADLFYEASVAGAIPLLRPLRESLHGDRINQFRIHRRERQVHERREER